MARLDPAAAARAAMPERYGRPSRAGRVVVVLAVVVTVGIASVWLVRTALEASTPDVTAGVVAFEVVSAGRTELTFEVRRAVPTAVTCDLYAQSEDKAIVGERTVQLRSAPAGSQTVTAPITTERRATTAVVRSCYDSTFPP